MVATSRFGRHTSPVSEGLDMRGRYEQAIAEVEEMKRTLREHAQHVAARERELEQLRLEVAGRQGRRRPSSPDRPTAPDPVRQDELSRKIAAAEKREKQAVQELALAKAERERLDEREQAIRKVERELAGQRMQLQDKLKVREALGLYASFYPHPADWRELLDRWGLSGKSNARFGKLSGGQKQRLFIALALVGRPEVVFLDELTSGLDPGARRATWELIGQVRDSGVTVVLVSHFMDEVEELCDRAAILEQGRIAALDTPAGLVDAAGGEYRLRFRPLHAIADEQSLTALPGVRAVSRQGSTVTVTGTGDFASAVTAELARRQVIMADLRIEGRSLDSAYVALTGQSMES